MAADRVGIVGGDRGVDLDDVDAEGLLGEIGILDGGGGGSSSGTGGATARPGAAASSDDTYDEYFGEEYDEEADAHGGAASAAKGKGKGKGNGKGKRGRQDTGKMVADATVAHTVKEGKVTVVVPAGTFYNPVQQFNRDLSVVVLNVWAKHYVEEMAAQQPSRRKSRVASVLGTSSASSNSNSNSTSTSASTTTVANGVSANATSSASVESGQERVGVKILEGLAASGLRSVRYAKEVAHVKSIIANDIDPKSVPAVEKNVAENCIPPGLVVSSTSDVNLLMANHPQEFDAIDLDPYGTAEPFLDAALKGLADGGLLLVTCTDSAVLSGHSPEVCLARYGSQNFKASCFPEMAIRVLLACIERKAAPMGRYIVPIVSLNSAFYIRVFVRVFTNQNETKKLGGKLSFVCKCSGCETLYFQPCGKRASVSSGGCVKCPAAAVAVPPLCVHCHKILHFAGPIYSEPIHNREWLRECLAFAERNKASLNTFNRIRGTLNVMSEELPDIPLYWTVPSLCHVLRTSNPPRSGCKAFLEKLGYHTSQFHNDPDALKTDAPSEVVWDMMRRWAIADGKTAPEDPKSAAAVILEQKPKVSLEFPEVSSKDKAKSKQNGPRFLPNPEKYWGPGARAGRKRNVDNTPAIEVDTPPVEASSEDNTNNTSCAAARLHPPPPGSSYQRGGSPSKRPRTKPKADVPIPSVSPPPELYTEAINEILLNIAKSSNQQQTQTTSTTPSSTQTTTKTDNKD
ncbi:tRNA methyltransferase, Trm1, S-adenosyl-L-methionine-dependent methyltransferase [Pelomyxa schiedti]|nr:tRNA methyltransferase, Trm1, S-adenosyl-L-methionine-dependent methyltransferase [Pelomyxa schiedti]